MLSHELRTPLNAIIGFSDLLLLMPENMSQTQIDNVKRVARAGRHLFSLVSDLLNMSAIEAGKVQLNYERVEIEPFIQEIIESFATYVQTKNITLNSEIKAKIGFFDKTRIQEVVCNLICNAVKYTNEGDTVTVIVTQHTSSLVFSVEDTGVGISEQDLKRIFEPFEQIKAGYNNEGVGLGLTICKRLITLHKGKFEVASILGHGSKFSFTLPLTPICSKSVRLLQKS